MKATLIDREPFAQNTGDSPQRGLLSRLLHRGDGSLGTGPLAGGAGQTE